MKYIKPVISVSFILALIYYGFNAYKTNNEWDQIPSETIVNAGRVNVSNFSAFDLKTKCNAKDNAFVDYKSTSHKIYIRCNSLHLYGLGNLYTKFGLLQVDKNQSPQTISYLF